MMMDKRQLRIDNSRRLRRLSFGKRPDRPKGNRDVRVVAYLGGDWFAVQWLFLAPDGTSQWRNHSQHDDEGVAVAAAEEFAERSGHTTGCQVVWRSWAID